MAFFDEVGDAEVTGSSAFFQPGLYLVALQKIKQTSGNGGAYVIVEGKIVAVKSTHPSAPAAGTTAAQMIKMGESGTDRRQMALRDFKQFLTALAGAAGNDYTAEQWNALSVNCVGEALSGKVMALECFNKPTKNGNDFTRFKWLRCATSEDYAAFGIEAP